MMPAVEIDDDIVDIGSRLVGWSVVSAAPVSGGGNNRIYRLSGAGGSAALKFYPLQDKDQRDRLRQEFTALAFLARHGIADVPKPIACDPVNRCAAYEWIGGEPARTAIEADVDALADFFLRLQELRAKDGAEGLSAASASCFSPRAVLRQLQERLQRIREVALSASAVADFVDDCLVPAAEATIGDLKRTGSGAGLGLDQDVPRSLQVLSPSDFGLHNALRREDGTLVFIDFEYFGWDDPAKAIADVMLHRGTALSPELGARYRSRVETVLGVHDKGLSERLDLIRPLIALIWCLILLNEFLPERWARRTLAGQDEGRDVVLARQLEKSRDLFCRNFA